RIREGARVRRALFAMAVLALTASAAQAAYEEIALKDGGTLSGVVRFAGTPPKLDPLPVHRNREVCGEQKASEALVVGPDRGVRVRCDAHPHMFAWLIVHDSPYVAVTDDRGAFRIADVPPGTYKVTMWHEGFRPRGVDKDGRPLYDEPRTMTRHVTIAPKGAATV